MKLRDKILRILFWAVALIVVLWAASEFPIYDRESTLGTIVSAAVVALAAVCGAGLGRAILNLRKKRDAQNDSRPHSWLRDVGRILISIVVIFVLGWFLAGLKAGAAPQTVRTFVLTLFIFSFGGPFIALLLLGINAKSRVRGGKHVLRIGIGLMLICSALGVGLLWLAGLIAMAIVEKGNYDVQTIIERVFIVGIFAFFGLFLLLMLLVRIQFDDERVYARFDRFKIREHCDLWKDLTSTEEARGKIILTFSGGGKVSAAVGITGYRDLADFARKVLARNQCGEGKT
ncbi:MAG TPA: hypothetical protein VMY41_04675 [Thermohalobaculum sp.]|nr:hypothetical protein [Thermohalobaculum sp.]